MGIQYLRSQNDQMKYIRLSKKMRDIIHRKSKFLLQQSEKEMSYYAYNDNTNVTFVTNVFFSSIVHETKV